MIICDTRERKNSHILAYFDKHDIPYEVKKLDTGDYMNTDNETVTIDRKRNLEEISGNICCRPDKAARFKRELHRALDGKMQMVVLIEESRYHSIDDVKRWKSKYSRVTGGQLARQMRQLENSYGVKFQFCSSRSTGRMILELLNYGH